MHWYLLLRNYWIIFQALFQINKYDEAAEIYTKLAEFWPDNPKVYFSILKYLDFVDLVSFGPLLY